MEEICARRIDMITFENDYSCGAHPAVLQRLAELGFVVDEEVTVLSASYGNLIVKVKEARIAIGLDMANRILV